MEDIRFGGYVSGGNEHRLRRRFLDIMNVESFVFGGFDFWRIWSWIY